LTALKKALRLPSPSFGKTVLIAKRGCTERERRERGDYENWREESAHGKK
jgi:hypothetical protein